jgi:hypothetical protein
LKRKPEKNKRLFGKIDNTFDETYVRYMPWILPIRKQLEETVRDE